MTKKTKESNKKRNTKDEAILDLDKEIIIGIKTLPEEKAPKKNQNKKKQNKKQIIKQEHRTKGTKKNRNNESKNKKNTKKNIQKRETVFRIVKYTTLVAILIGGGIYFLLSPYFNVTEINVLGNERITKEEIISLSEIKLNENTFKIQNSKVQRNIKQNAYIETVSIKRKLPNEVEITVEERKPTFMLSFANAYIYLNNQGYMLEVSNTKLENPIITGFLTKEEDLHAGNRLCSEDLTRLGQALQIMQSAESNGIANLITKINIENKQDYILELKSEKKTVHMGDSSNLSTKMLYIISILNENKNVEGEIFVNTDLNTKGAVFRKKI